jgi:hypothetical protein
MPSRRQFLGGVTASLAVTAGCLGSEDQSARCSSESVGYTEKQINAVVPIIGDDQVALAIGISTETVEQSEKYTLVVRNRDDELVASIPLDSNREMSRLSHEDYNFLGPDDGELYAVLLGQPPVHGEYTVSLLDSDEQRLESVEMRFNCYDWDGSIP